MIRKLFSIIYDRLDKIISSISQTINCVLLFGDVDESISARCYRTNSKLEKVVNILFFFQKDHCYKAHLSDITRADWILKHKRLKIKEIKLRSELEP